MSLDLLLRIRFAGFLLLAVSGLSFFGTAFRLWDFGPVGTIVSLGLMLSSCLVLPRLQQAIENAERREGERRKQLAANERAAGLELAKRRAAMRMKAVELARNEYPQYLDEHALVEQGWRDDGYDLIEMFLEPAEMILEYAVEGDAEKGSLKLYDRERVKHEEERNSEVARARREILAVRTRRAQAALEEELEVKRAAEAKRAEEELKKELDERWARQKIVGIDERLKNMD